MAMQQVDVDEVFGEGTKRVARPAAYYLGLAATRPGQAARELALDRSLPIKVAVILFAVVVWNLLFPEMARWAESALSIERSDPQMSAFAAWLWTVELAAGMFVVSLIIWLYVFGYRFNGQGRAVASSCALQSALDVVCVLLFWLLSVGIVLTGLVGGQYPIEPTELYSTAPFFVVYAMISATFFAGSLGLPYKSALWRTALTYAISILVVVATVIAVEAFHNAFTSDFQT